MSKREYNGYITAKQEFLYPDQSCKSLAASLYLAIAKNGRRHIQLLLETEGDNVSMTTDSAAFEIEWFQLIPIPVGYNTGDGEEQGGAMILKNRPAVKPEYATRLAPFTVYDCLRPMPDGKIPVHQGKAAVCLTLKPKEDTHAGQHHLTIKAETETGIYECRVTIHVYNVMIPEDRYPVTYWFSLDDICRFHQVEFNTPTYFSVLLEYIRAMRRARQNVFFMLLDERCVVAKDPYDFDFEYLTPTIELFFKHGMKRMEIGHLLARGIREDGSKDMYSGSFKCAMAPSIPINNIKGYEISVRYVKKLADYLEKHEWLDKVLFHIHDEPDIHVESPIGLESRIRDYQLAGNILRRIIPGAKVIEATKSTIFRGGIDILVPDTAGFEAHRNEFELLAQIGHEVWSYVCCGPEGMWLNRFLDYAVIKDRLLFWGFAKNKISGFLHWGFNQFPDRMNPFIATECPNDTGIGTDFPCGDSFMVYPGDNRPWISLRLEAWRQGAEDIELIHMLQKKSDQITAQLIADVFTDNQHYNEDPDHFETVYESLLKYLSLN